MTYVRAVKSKVDSVGVPSALLPRLAIPVDTSAIAAHVLLTISRPHSQVLRVASRLTGQVVASESEHT